MSRRTWAKQDDTQGKEQIQLGETAGSERLSAHTMHRGYMKPKAAEVDHELYDQLSASGWDNIVQKFTIPVKSGKAWEMKAGQTCRIVLQGPQVGDVNFWNLHNFSEKFYSGKTRQIHKAHLSTYDRLWSNMPHLRPLATITKDSLAKYGFDEEGCSVHDVLGTRCDPYIKQLISGIWTTDSCHQYLMEAVKPWGLQEQDIHDVFNIFMCTGLDPKTDDYMIKGTPAGKGDYIEWLAEIDLLVANSVCPCGDVSQICGDDTSPTITCHPMDVYVGQPSAELLQKWQK